MSMVGLQDDVVGHDTTAFLGKKGITGLVQINNRGELSDEEVEKFNLYYAKNQSLTLDIEILLKTFFMIIKNKNAYGKSGIGI